MNKTTIDWPGLTHTWNPIVGCRNGCPYCYARVIHNRRHKAYKAGKELPRQYAEPFNVIQFFPERLNDPVKHKKPAVIFVGSMCDIFSDGVSPIWVQQIIEVAEKCPQHRFMFLTKKPVHYAEYKWPRNCWLGTTMEDVGKHGRSAAIMANDNNLFVSIEPIQSSFEGFYLGHFSLVIVGRDSTPGAPIPPARWIESVKHPNIHYKKNITDIYPQFRNS